MSHSHICLVSGQVLPNLIPLLDPVFGVERAILVVSNEVMRKKADAMEHVLKKHGQIPSLSPLHTKYLLRHHICLRRQP